MRSEEAEKLLTAARKVVNAPPASNSDALRELKETVEGIDVVIGARKPATEGRA